MGTREPTAREASGLDPNALHVISKSMLTINSLGNQPATSGRVAAVLRAGQAIADAVAAAGPGLSQRPEPGHD